MRVSPGVFDAESYGLKSNIADMIHFLDAHLGNIEVRPEVSEALARTRVAEFATEPFLQAMIWEGYDWPLDPNKVALASGAGFATSVQPMKALEKPVSLDDMHLLSKTGSTNGFGAYVALLPSERIGVVVLANRNFPNEQRMLASGKLMAALIAARAG